jgi:hypothetical protein
MPKGRARSGILTAFACWLILLASGDDFNFARMAFLPSPLPSEDLLPLDDPNTDFTESSQTPSPTTISRNKGGCTSSVGQRVAGTALTLLSAASTSSRPPRPPSNAPLRC